jgi:Short C-terminal domain
MFRARKVLRRRAIAPTAVVGGAAYYVAKRGARAEQQEQTEPEGAPSSAPNPAQLDQIAELREQGILTEEEFAAERRKLLGI